MFGSATTMAPLVPPSAGATVGSALLEEPAPAASSPLKWSTEEAAKCSPQIKKIGITKGKVQGNTPFLVGLPH